MKIIPSIGSVLASCGLVLASGVPARALTIVPTYDSTITSQSVAAQNQIESAFAYAAAQFQNSFADPITINITVSTSAGVGLGQSNTSLQTTTYTPLRAALLGDATTTNDATANASLPVTDPTGASTYIVSFAQAKALGLRTANNTATDGTFTFGSSNSYTFDPANRVVAGKYDFIGTAEHEISEIMGRIGILGASLTGTPNYGVFDLFSFTALNSRSLNQTNTGVYFSINGGLTNLKNFNNPGNGGDLRDWASGSNDAFNAFSSSGVQNDITAVDLQAMDVIGYNLVPEPGTNAALAIGAALLAGTVFRARKKSVPAGS